MNLTDDERDLIALHLVTGIGPRLTAALLDRFGSASAVLRATADELRDVPYLGAKVADALRQALANPDVGKECARSRSTACICVSWVGPTIPPNSPPSMTRRICFSSAATSNHVTTSRSPSSARGLAPPMANAWPNESPRTSPVPAGPSSAAWRRGIDACAHRGALQANGRTIAVLAGGLSKIYPPEHAELANEVSASGALVTESCMRMEPMATLFPARNRIISGLSRAVVVIEAAEKSGALITARLAAEQGREVFAIPGPVDSPASMGTHQLLRKGAKLVRHADDILEDLQGIPALVEEKPTPPPAPPTGLDETQQKIWDALSERRLVDDLTFQLSDSNHGPDAPPDDAGIEKGGAAIAGELV